MSSLTQLKQEARDEFDERYGKATDGANGAMFSAMKSDLDTLIDKVVDAVENMAVLEVQSNTIDATWEAERSLLEAFSKFRNS